MEQGVASWIPIDLITKEDLFELLNKAIDDDFEMDAFNEVTLSNKAHQIIYKNIYEKFANLLSDKTRFKTESESMYKDALEKYKVDT